MTNPLFDPDGIPRTLLFNGAEESSPRHTTQEILDHWTGFMLERTRKGFDNIILFTGDEGSGKTADASYFARRVDPEFDRLYRAHQFAERFKLSPKETLDAVSEAKRGDVILFDEAAMGIMSQDRFDDAARALVRAVNISRKIGNSLFLAIPDVWDVTRTFRARRSELMFYHEYRKFLAWPHLRRHRLAYEQPGKELNLWIDKEWSPVRWPNPERTADWQAYKAWSVERAREILRHESDNLDTADPRGQMARCPDCGLQGSRWNVATHRCQARKPLSA